MTVPGAHQRFTRTVQFSAWGQASLSASLSRRFGEADDPALHGGLFVNIESCAQGGAYPVQNFAQLVELAQKRGPKTIAVAAAAQKAVSLAVNEAEEWGIADVILIGDQLPSTIHVRGDRLRIIVLRWALHL